MEIYEKVEFDNDIHLRVNLIEINRDYDTVVDKHWHRSVEILAPIEGDIYLWIAGRNVVVKPGEMYIINSREIHAVHGIKNEQYRGYMMQIGYDFLVSCFQEMDDIYFAQVKNQDTYNKLIDLIKKINFYCNSDEVHNKLMIEGLLFISVHILLSSQKRIRSNGRLIESDKNRKRIIKITEYIEKHYEDELTVEMLADKFNLSYGHFVRLFKENLNLTVKEYITNIRINKCREDLLNTDYQIVQIALQNGFPNIQSFYKEFKKMFKMTPAKYRKISQINK